MHLRSCTYSAIDTSSGLRHVAAAIREPSVQRSILCGAYFTLHARPRARRTSPCTQGLAQGRRGAARGRGTAQGGGAAASDRPLRGGRTVRRSRDSASVPSRSSAGSSPGVAVDAATTFGAWLTWADADADALDPIPQRVRLGALP